MVQFEDQSKFLTGDYWKLDPGTRRIYNTKDQILRVLSPNEQYLKSRSIARIRELYIRRQRGLLLYERLTVRELRSFVKQRGLTPTSTTKPTVAILRAQLEQADDDATFDRFSDLPPELSQQIFRQYFDSFDGRRRQKTPAGPQPPITLVSRRIRLEALPLFYSRCHFGFHAGWFTSASVMSTETFSHNTPAYNFARIRFLNLNFTYSHNQIGYSVRIVINLHDDECSAKVSYVLPSFPASQTRMEGSDQDDDKHEEAVTTKLNQLLTLEPHTFIRSIAARPGCLKLQKNDMLELYKVLERAVRQVVGKTD